MYQDEKFMLEAIKIAKYAEGCTSPNPLVGAIIVKNNRIVANGWHRKAGTKHAEIHALDMAGSLAKDATLYVTLEPCSHSGKMPPCVDAIISAKIKRVVIGSIDSNPLVAGKGINKLREAGIDVKVGVLEKEVKQMNEFFFKWIETKLPFVILKTATTLDGKIATTSGASKWITSESSRKDVHILRSKVDAVLVGINTVISDNPSLTVRLDNQSTSHNPLRIVLDSFARTPLNANIVTDNVTETIIAVTSNAPQKNIDALKKLGATVIIVNEGTEIDLKKLLLILGSRNITSLLVEGGGNVNFSFLNQGLVDKVYAYLSPKFFGGTNALTSVEGKGVDSPATAFSLSDITINKLDNDICLIGYLRK